MVLSFLLLDLLLLLTINQGHLSICKMLNPILSKTLVLQCLILSNLFVYAFLSRLLNYTNLLDSIFFVLSFSK